MNKNELNLICFVLFHVSNVRDTAYKCNVLNGTHVGEIRDVLYCTSRLKLHFSADLWMFK